jgi:16S rRNA (adenine1518-N6/adenine1519-N6)-dimethyltransferase
MTSLYRTTKNLLKNAGIHPKKGLGQNFLIEETIFNFIIESANLSSDDIVLELGSGVGLLTRELAISSGKVIAVELDSELFRILQSNCVNLNNVILVNADMLELDFSRLFDEYAQGNKVNVIGNLPYYITTPILLKLLEKPNSTRLKKVLLMVQKEVGERLVSPPGRKDYGSITIAVAYRCAVRIVNVVPANCFYPKPKVDSVIIELSMRDEPYVSVKDEELFFQVVRGSFQHRRKTLRNALLLSVHSGRLKVSPNAIDTALQSLGLDPKVRGETLSIEQFADLTNRICLTLEKRTLL